MRDIKWMDGPFSGLFEPFSCTAIDQPVPMIVGKRTVNYRGGLFPLVPG
jgi:hypothetical protein